MFGFGIWELLILLFIVILVFGTKKLKGLGGSFSGIIDGFKKSYGDQEINITPESEKENSNNSK